MPDQTPQRPDDRRGPNGPQPPPPMRFNRNLATWVLFLLLGLLLVMVVFQNVDKPAEIRASDFWAALSSGQIEQLIVKDQRIEGRYRDGVAGRSIDAPEKFFVKYDYRADESFQAKLEASGVSYTYDLGESWWVAMIPQLLFWLVIFLAIWFFFFRQFRGAGGGAGILGNFGRSRHRVATKEHVSVTFDDVAGIEEAKDEVREVVEFLRNPKRFQRIGARIPRGVLLVGDPGCGKTLLAKAIAGEADVPFFSISGSDFVEMFVGVGASRVRDLFKQAKENSPCIIFLDEIDAVGRRRGTGFNGGGHDEREQTLNAILVEMDGFDTNDQVIVIAATNRVDVLDPALTRPGRFDRQINVPLPDVKGRLEILRIYAKRIKLGGDVELNRLARGTPMFSGADLAALINEAAISATLANKEYVEQADLEEARDKVRWGRAKRSRVVDEQEKIVTAYHEAGHALVQMLTPKADPLHKVSIIPRGPAGGATFSLPERDRYIYTRSYCGALLRVCVGGRLAEQLFCEDISSGASGDIQQATTIARKMVLDWGMSEKLGFVQYSGEDGRMPFGDMSKDYSDATAEVIDAEVRRILDEAQSEALDLIETHRDALESLAQALLKYETLDGEEVRQIIDGKPLNRPTVTDLLDAERTKGRPAPRVSDRGTEHGPSLDTIPQPG